MILVFSSFDQFVCETEQSKYACYYFHNHFGSCKNHKGSSNKTCIGTITCKLCVAIKKREKKHDDFGRMHLNQYFSFIDLL